ncbi:MAG TPA: hypothetical protein VGS19_00730 [Streptosporangiaceae bacterium]|nr:hypothetical protein [Streptosporangiaceae bacterium]
MSVLAPDHAGVRDRWLTALAELVPVPPGYRNESIDRIGALDILRCDDAMLTDLVEHGLPSAGGELFDRYDLFNLALYSGTGKSAPETGIRYALRWMGREPDTWFAEREWNLSVELFCPRPDGCRPGPTWSAARPEPEAFGGQTLRLDTAPAGQADRFALTAEIVTRGERRELCSDQLREIVGEYTTGSHRWVRLPVELQARPELVLPHGVAPCISVSLDLAAKCRAAGFDARTRRGWILGMLDLAHAWLEVVDTDGQVKVIDPVFALLADHADAAHPQFRQACAGSRFNRLLPSCNAADEPLFRHHCGGEGLTPATRTTVRSARSGRCAEGS